jgi:hypothetical protein
MKERTEKERLESIEEAIADWRKGELTDLAALTAIGMIINSNYVSEEAMQWAINLLKEQGEI